MATSTAPVFGSILTKITLDTIKEWTPVFQVNNDRPKICSCSCLASYNWLAAHQPTIVVPGAPPTWAPPADPPQLREDEGQYYRDINAGRFPSHPMQPAIEALLDCEPRYNLDNIDLFADSSTLVHLLKFVDAEHADFRFIVEVVGRSVFFIRRENSPDELMTRDGQRMHGYGHAMPEAYTSLPADVKGSVSHQRIIEYKFADMKCLIRSQADGYLPHLCSVAAPSGVNKQTEANTAAVQDPIADTRPTPGPTKDESRSGDTDMSSHNNGNDADIKIQSSLTVKQAGSKIPQHAVFDLKTRHVSSQDRDILAERLPRLWLTQIPNFVLAFHEEGMFKHIEIGNVERQIKHWERQKEDMLDRFAILLKMLVAFARGYGKKRLEVECSGWRKEVRIRNVGGEVNEGLPRNMRKMWDPVRNERPKAPDGCQTM